MNGRETRFQNAFATFSTYLGARPDDLVSLKLRENVNSYDPYRELLATIQGRFGANVSPIPEMQYEKAWLIDAEGQKVIVVEHETGLEVLYVVGSVASIVGLVPLVLQAWRGIRGHFGHRRGPEPHHIEVRRLDTDGHLREEHVHADGPDWSDLGVALSATMQALRTDIDSISRRVDQISAKVQVLEEKAQCCGKRSASAPSRPRKRPKPKGRGRKG
jgi:hypothetical protein